MLSPADSPTPEANTTATRGGCDAATEEEFNDEAKANRAHIEQSLEILVRSMEDGANAVFSTLAQAAAECMDETSNLLPKDEGGAACNIWRMRDSRRQAELRNIGRLNEAGSRMLDACTRLRVTYDRSNMVRNTMLADLGERARQNSKPLSGEN